MSTYPDGTLLRASDQPQVWLIQSGQRHWIPSPQIFNDDGFSWSAIEVVTDAVVDAIPQAEDVPEFPRWVSPGPSDPVLPGQQLPVVESGGVDYRRWRSQGGGHTIYAKGDFVIDVVREAATATVSTLTRNSVVFAGYHSMTYAVITDASGMIVWTSPGLRVGVNPQGFSGQAVVVPATKAYPVPMDVADKANGLALVVSDSPDNLQQILAKSVGSLLTQVIQGITAIGGITGGSKKSGSATANAQVVAHTTRSAASQQRGWTEHPESRRRPSEAAA